MSNMRVNNGGDIKDVMHSCVLKSTFSISRFFDFDVIFQKRAIWNKHKDVLWIARKS